MTVLTRRVIWVGSLVAAAIAGAWIVELLLSFQAGEAFGHTQQGHLVGWLGLFIILLVFIYPMKKRFSPKPGWPKGWFRVHVIAGIVGPLVILVHSGVHLHALVPVFAMFAMGIVVLSGIVGQAIHTLALRGLNLQRRELAAKGWSEENIQSQLHEMASKEETFRVWQFIHAPLTVAFVVLTLVHIVGALYFGGL